MFMNMIELNSWCASWKKAKDFFLICDVGAMPRTTSLLQVRFATGHSHQDPPHRITGCYTHLGNHKKAQELLDACPALIEKRKVGATKYLPTETFILRKRKSLLPSVAIVS